MTPEVLTTKKERDIMRHSLGLDGVKVKKPYRNYFNTDEGCTDFDVCESLTAKGLMVKYGAGPIWPGYNYCVTINGAIEIGVNTKDPKITELLAPNPPLADEASDTLTA